MRRARGSNRQGVAQYVLPGVGTPAQLSLCPNADTWTRHEVPTPKARFSVERERITMYVIHRRLTRHGETRSCYYAETVNFYGWVEASAEALTFPSREAAEAKREESGSPAWRGTVLAVDAEAWSRSTQR